MFEFFYPLRSLNPEVIKMKFLFIGISFLFISCQSDNKNFISSYDFGNDDNSGNSSSISYNSQEVFTSTGTESISMSASSSSSISSSSGSGYSY